MLNIVFLTCNEYPELQTGDRQPMGSDHFDFEEGNIEVVVFK